MRSHSLAAFSGSTALGIALVFGLVLGAGACDRGAEADQSISPAALEQRIQAGTAPLILDVRTPQEYASGHIPGAVNIPYDQLSDHLSELGASHSDEIVVHCQSGHRASIAEGVLRKAGYTRVRDLEGSMAAWKKAGLPTE